jgi:hypothetical protein
MLISETYRKQNRRLHAENPHYGISGAKWRDKVRELAHWGRRAVLDYGAGKATLSASLGPAYRVTNYDPCVPGLEQRPGAHSVVVCGDVLEHVEPDCLAAVLDDLRGLTHDVAFVVVHLGPARKFLPDGRNAHLIQQPAEWWEARVMRHGFRVVDRAASAREAWFVLVPEVH